MNPSFLPAAIDKQWGRQSSLTLIRQPVYKKEEEEKEREEKGEEENT